MVFPKGPDDRLDELGRRFRPGEVVKKEISHCWLTSGCCYSNDLTEVTGPR